MSHSSSSKISKNCKNSSINKDLTISYRITHTQLHSSIFTLSISIFTMSILLKMYSRNNVKFEKMIHVFPIVGSLIVLGHSIVTMVERRYSLFSLSLFLYSDMMLVQYCRYAFERLPRREKSVRKFLLKLALFLLFSGNLFAIVCQSAPFYGPLTAALFYAMAIGGSIFLFYAYMIYDGDGGVDGGNYSDTEEKRHSAFPTMAESFSETV